MRWARRHRGQPLRAALAGVRLLAGEEGAAEGLLHLVPGQVRSSRDALGRPTDLASIIFRHLPGPGRSPGHRPPGTSGHRQAAGRPHASQAARTKHPQPARSSRSSRYRASPWPNRLSIFISNSPILG